MRNKILIVEDESSIRGFLKVSLQCNDYIVFEAESGEEGIRKAKLEKPDIIILDIMLPGIDGLEVCATLRKTFPELGIIMLTARTQDLDKIKGLEFGADDYVTKPFNPDELILRIKALLRRMSENTVPKTDSIIECYPFKIDINGRKISKMDIDLEMTPKEFLLMKLFIENPGKAFSRDELLNLVWGIDFFGDSKIVDVNIRRLRKKIEDTSSHPNYIETVWGTGYRWRKTESTD